ncbi:MAG TPA: hypothetical protein VLG15_06565 [Thermoanaerobaculia bacterium]|nr:hypothetical protein [Thermoanaerobaculia bacterium]
MTRAWIAGGAFAILLVLALAAGHRAFVRDVPPRAATPPAVTPAIPAGEDAHPDFLYGRITTHGGATYEGRLRWGGDQESFWGDYFNGFKAENPWVAHAPPGRLPRERRSIEIFGVEIGHRKGRNDLGRFFMARFGDIARVEADGRDVRVTLKSGTVFDLDRFEASDFDDGVRVWDVTRGVVNLTADIETEFLARIDGNRRIRTIELLPTSRLHAVPYRLYGTVRTREGEFTGFVQWDREECVGSDLLDGKTSDGPLGLRFDTIRSIARHSVDSSRVTLADGREIVLSGSREVGQGNRGIYVDDRRYGRVLVSWEAFERIDFRPGGSGPAYGDFPPGRALAGTVTTRAGRRFTGRLVYDLDESETTETLDAPSRGVDYTIPFGMVASIALPGGAERGADRVRVTLQNSEQLELERAGDLGEKNAGMLIFVDGRPRPEYVPWTDVAQIELDRPLAMYPPLGGRPVTGARTGPPPNARRSDG